MLPAERGNMLDDVGRRRNALPVEFGESRFEIERVPVDNGVDQQVQSGCSIELALEGPVAQFSETLRSGQSGEITRLYCQTSIIPRPLSKVGQNGVCGSGILSGQPKLMGKQSCT